MLQYAVSPSVRSRIDALDMDFNKFGLDKFGVSRDHIAACYSLLEPFYRRYFRVKVFGIEHVPNTGRGMARAKKEEESVTP